MADWDHDGLLDIVANSIWGKIIWYRNIGVPGKPLLENARPINVAWQGPPPKPAWNWWDPAGDELVTQWRTTPAAVDWNQDGLTDLIMLDHEGHLAFFERARQKGKVVLLPGKRIFVDERETLIRSSEVPPEKAAAANFRSSTGTGMVDWIYCSMARTPSSTGTSAKKTARSR